MSAIKQILRSLRRAWWFTLWRLRPVGRLLLARTGWGAQAVAARNVWHWVFSNAISVAVKVGLWILVAYDPLPWRLEIKTILVIAVLYNVAFMLLYSLATNGGSPSRFIMRFRLARIVFGWRLAWRFRARWPMEWSIAAAKTRTVQAEVGSSSEPTVTIRPVFDAPKLSWWPRIQWPVMSWWISPPPGRTFAQFELMLDVLASNMANVVAVTLDYERSSSSIGRISVIFDDPLVEPVLPDYHVAEPEGYAEASLTEAEVDDENMADVIDLRPRHTGPRTTGVS